MDNSASDTNIENIYKAAADPQTEFENLRAVKSVKFFKSDKFEIWSWSLSESALKAV